MPMMFRKYSRGAALPSPVYIDANIWVSYFIPTRPKYQLATTILSDVISQSEILVSTLVFSEIWWAVLEHTYNEARQSAEPGFPPTRFSVRTLARHSKWLTAVAEDRLTLVSTVINGLPSVRMVPQAIEPLCSVPAVIRKSRLAPGDATHLCLANQFARSFFTEDSDFASCSDPDSSLAIYII